MDTPHNQRITSDDAAATVDGDRQGGPGEPGQVERRSSRGRRLFKRVAAAGAAAVLVVVVGVTVWLAPPVFDRESPPPVADPEPLEPTGHVDVGGTELPYLEQGTGPPVLLVHGGGSGVREFEAVVEALADDHRVIIYNRRGYEGAGAHVTTEDPLPHVDAAAVLADLDAEGAIVAGHSSGAGIATRLAQERPDLVAGLVLLEPAVEEEIPLSFIRVAIATQIRQLFMSDERAPIPLLRWLLTHDDGYSPWDEDPAFTDEMKHHMLSAGGAPSAELELLDAAGVDFFPREGLDELDMPVTLVVGERSRPHFHRSADTLGEEIPGAARTELPETGHGMQLENPSGTADAIRQTTQAAFRDTEATTEP